MYEELIRRLREEPLDSNKAALPIMDLCIDAATAIENLSHRLDMAQGERDAVTRHMIELEQDVCRLKSRLAAYEDTGLEPEEIADFMKRWERTVEIAGLCKKGGIDHLLELKKSEQNGQLAVLPCGTDVELVRDGHAFKADHWNHTLTAFRDAPENKSGKQVALFSIKEAEAALKGGEG